MDIIYFWAWVESLGSAQAVNYFSDAEYAAVIVAVLKGMSDQFRNMKVHKLMTNFPLIHLPNYKSA